MKSLIIIILAAMVVGYTACSPAEEKDSLPTPPPVSNLKFEVSQKQGKDNVVYLKSLTPNAIPYWDYNSGTSTRAQDTVIYPFSGDYLIKYGVNASGGFVPGDSVTVHVTTTDLSYITDPAWAFLTNGQPGKTWKLNMAKPIGWFGLDYGKGSGDDWSWHPDYAGNEWVMPNKDYGEMTFNLNNAKNYQRIIYDANNNPVTCNGKFDMDLAQKKIKLFGCDMLFGGPQYFSQVSNWRDMKILSLTETSMILGVVRDKPLPGDGVCYIGFCFQPK